MGLKKITVFLAVVLSIGFSQTLEVTFQETQSFKIDGLVKHIVLEHNDYLKAERKGSTLIIKGLKPGSSKVLVFTEKKEGSKVVKTKNLYAVRINPRKLEQKDKSNVDYSGNVFYANLNFGYGHSRSRPKHTQDAQHNWDSTYMFYKFDAQGETPWGYMTKRLYIKNNANYQGVYRFSIKLQNSLGLFTVGDQYYTDKSNIIFPAQPLQGLSYDGVMNNLDIMIFYGKNNFGQWAKKMERDERDDDLFMFGSIDYNLDRDSYFGLNFNNYAGSLLYKTVFNNNLDIYGELGLDKSSDIARELKLEYSNKKDFRGDLAYHHYDENFYIPVGVVDFRGYRGWRYNSSYDPFYYLSLKLDGENYKKSIASVSYDQYRNHAQLYFKGEEYKKTLPDLVIDYNDSRGKSNTNYDYKQSQYVFQLKKKIYGIDTWYKFIPMQYTNNVSSNANYKKNSSVLGGKIYLAKNFSYQGEYSWENFDMTSVTDYNEYVFNNFFYLHTAELQSTKVYLDGFYQHITRYNDNLRERYTNNYFSMAVNYHPNPDGHLRISSYRKIIDEPDVYERSRTLDELRVEYSQNFNYSIKFAKGRAQLSGMVFMDDNYNGLLDENERGVPGIPVTLSDGKIATTNKYGIYRFRDIPTGKYSLDIIEGKRKIMFTDEYPKYVQITAQQKRVNVNFGVIMTNRIYGYVFADLNENGVKDSGENTVYKNVRVIIGDTIVKTNRDGYYEYLSRDEGGLFDVQIDFSSIPVFHKLIGKRKFPVVGSGRYDFVIAETKKKPYGDNYLDITSINKKSNSEYVISGKLLKPILSVYINNKRVKIIDGEFSSEVPRIGDKIKIKVFTRDKTFFVKYFSY